VKLIFAALWALAFAVLPASRCSFASAQAPSSQPAPSSQSAPSSQTPVPDEPLSVPAIVYPAEAKALHITGVVELEVSVDPTGKVSNVRVLSGPVQLRQAAVDAYYQATYPPMMKAGRAIPAIVRTRVNFSLNQAPPPPDDALEKRFEAVHANCQELSLERSEQALPTCRQAVDLARQFTTNAHLDARATAYNDLILLLIANGKYAGKGSTAPNPALPEAGILADQAVQLVSAYVPATAGPHTPALAVAYISRAEVRSLAGDLKGSIADCIVAEETLTNLIADQAAPTEKKVDRTANYKSQLRDVFELHAVMLDRQGNRKQAKVIRDREASV
jgi:TonB family protein